MTQEEFDEFYLGADGTDKLFGTSPMIKKLFTQKQLLRAKNWHYSGFWILEQQSQVTDPGMFGGPEVMKDLENFIARGAPVYMGWGSMTKVPPDRMLRVAIGALKLAGLRAIISKGWASLSHEALHEVMNESDPDGLCEYAKANVMFIDKAPHEWLFPKCSCTVHHGGAGTTAATLRAGVPTVITPIVYDQFEHAKWVNQLGTGVGLRDFMEVEVEELADALKRTASETEMAEQAKKMAEVIKREPGTKGAVDTITRIIRDKVLSGWAKTKFEAESKEDREKYEKWLAEEHRKREEWREAQKKAMENSDTPKLQEGASQGEEVHVEEAKKQVDEEINVEEEKKLDEKKKQKLEDERRQAEEKRQDEERKQKLEDERRQAEEKRQAEERRQEEERRQKLEDEARRAEEKKQEEQRRQEEERKQNEADMAQMQQQDLDVTIFIDRSLDLKSSITLKHGSTMWAIKECLAKDDPTGMTSAADFGLKCPQTGRVLGNEELLTPAVAELDVILS